jgi:hypothetical protein
MEPDSLMGRRNRKTHGTSATWSHFTNIGGAARMPSIPLTSRGKWLDVTWLGDGILEACPFCVSRLMAIEEVKHLVKAGTNKFGFCSKHPTSRKLRWKSSADHDLGKARSPYGPPEASRSAEAREMVWADWDIK